MSNPGGVPSSQRFRPEPAFRLGVTGARKLDPAALPRLEVQILSVLRRLRDDLDDVVADSEERAVYSTSSVAIRVLSPLAVGADRLVARIALKPEIGASLFVPMPFSQDEYERDFAAPEDLADFRDLLAQATEGSLALDGARGDLTESSYEAVGRTVVRQSDLVIALWDGKSALGRGGTADIVRYAAAMGVPVIWVHATEDRPPSWITGPLDLRYPAGAASDWGQALNAHLTELLRLPLEPSGRPHGVIEWCGRRFQDRRTHLDRYFAETSQPRRKIWRAYAALIALTTSARPPWPPVRRPAKAIACYWSARFDPLDGLASDFAERYRSSYIWLFLLATIALGCGATALALTPVAQPAQHVDGWASVGKTVFTLGEFVCLLTILVLVLAVKGRDWHRRSIEYRLLAELCRKQQVLVPLGRALPITAVRRAVEEPGGDVRSPIGWVAWLFSAWQRAAPFAAGDLAGAAATAGRDTVQKLISEQVVYHKARHSVAQQASASLEGWSLALFAIVAVCVISKLALSPAASGAAIVLGWAATVVPAISAALVGIRAYAELELLSAQSQHMHVELERVRARLARIEVTKPLAVQDVGSEAATVSALMLEDLEGWARLFRIKVAELA